MGEREKDWDQYLDPILFAIRTSVQASMKHTPFFLIHGREARLPLEVEKADFIADSKQLPEINRIIEQLTKLKDEIFPAVMANIDIAQTRQKDQYSKRKGLGKQEIKVGDTVMRLNMLQRTKKGHKTEDTWMGTYKVLEITKYGSCRLHCEATNTTLKHKINLAQSKLFRRQDSGSPDRPTNSGHLNQPTDQADSYQPTDQADRRHPDQPTDSGRTDDDLIILEKELLNESLFRLVQYESSYYRNGIIICDDKLNVNTPNVATYCIAGKFGRKLKLAIRNCSAKFKFDNNNE